MFVPLLGYLILFNDGLSDHLQFRNLISNPVSYQGIEEGVRLRLVYFGLIFLGVSNFVYRLRKPRSLLIGHSASEYIKNCFDFYTYSDYEDVHARIYDSKNKIIYGPTFDQLWSDFVQDAKRISEDGITWDSHKAKHGSFMRSLLKSDFHGYDRRYRKSLMSCLILTSAGYILLSIPSIDLFLKVLLATL